MKMFKKLTSLALLATAFFSSAVFACDEQCMREKAEAKHNVKFPGYLTFKYCDSIAMDFMTSTMRSLQNYRDNHLESKYKGPLKNTKAYLEQREDWLKECDDYLVKTKNIRIFNDDKTTKQIFATIDAVEEEFEALINGVTYSADNQFVVINDRFDNLFKQVEDHKHLMHLKGRYVVR
ncbi:hypothetical protein TDB9533_04289 [Thalassocella blandensis]|nr:hypothetical protein TDB9533_04289 [Thalassocella blandensis]